MPAAPRQNRFATKVCRKIIGMPANMVKHPEGPEEQWIRERLMFKEENQVK
jgi:hypothetical protein